MKFGAWYPLSEAGELAPAREGVLQVRLAAGLIEYPRGKSAMVWYQHAPDLQRAVRTFADRHAGAPLVCRHLIELEDGVDLGAFCESLRDQFERRFGALPQYEQP